MLGKSVLAVGAHVDNVEVVKKRRPRKNKN
jgi:hypothetical protein